MEIVPTVRLTMDTVMVVGTTAEDIDITAKKAAMADILNVHQEINVYEVLK